MAGPVTTDNINQPKADAEPEILPDGTERKSSYDAATEGTPGAVDGTKTDIGGVPTATLAEQGDHQSDLARMKAYFASRPKVSIFIPADQDEHVIVNGYAYHLKRGEQVEVPIDIAEILKDAWRGRASSQVVRRIETQEF